MKFHFISNARKIRLWALKGHIKSKHPEVKEESPTRSCEICEKTFRYQANFVKHRKTHAVTTCTWSCPIYGIGLESQEKLFEHEHHLHENNPPTTSSIDADDNRVEDPEECPNDVESICDCEEDEMDCFRKN